MSDEIHYQLTNSVSSATGRAGSACAAICAPNWAMLSITWFARLELEQRQEDAVLLTVPHEISAKSWIRSHYAGSHQGSPVRRIPWRRSSDDRPTFCIAPDKSTGSRRGSGRRRGATRPLAAERAALAFVKSPGGKPATPHETDIFSGSPLDRRLSFSTFLVGPSNQLAVAAASRIANARHGDLPLFNPLYAHASVALGKTHLLQAVARAANDNKRRVIYLTAEKFMSGFVSALTAHTAIAFKEKLRAIDVLIIDDVQFLQGKSIQHEFCHTLNALIDAGRQVVVAADRPPSELETLDERVLSRLKGGLCVDIGPLDEELRIKILEARITVAQKAQPNFRVPPTVISYVAKTVVTNGRDSKGRSIACSPMQR